MSKQVYLYHYYPIYDAHKLESIANVEHETVDCLFKKYGKSAEPFRSLYRATLPIAEEKIWVSSSGLLNDPFEFGMYFSQEYYTNEVAYGPHKKNQDPLKDLELQKQIQIDAFKNNGLIPGKLLENKPHGIFSMSKSPKNLLMWSHYSNSHAGICVRFKIHKKLIETVKSKKLDLISYTDGQKLLFGKVNYYPKPLTITYSSYASYSKWHSELGISEITVWDKIACDVMLGKYRCWKYEKEYRLILLGTKNSVSISDFIYPGTKERTFEADAIIFGLNTEPSIKRIIQNSFEVPCYGVSTKGGTYNLVITRL